MLPITGKVVAGPDRMFRFAVAVNEAASTSAGAEMCVPKNDGERHRQHQHASPAGNARSNVY
jgi:hypothetical protein